MALQCCVWQYTYLVCISVVVNTMGWIRIKFQYVRATIEVCCWLLETKVISPSLPISRIVVLIHRTKHTLLYLQDWQFERRRYYHVVKGYSHNQFKAEPWQNKVDIRTSCGHYTSFVLKGKVGWLWFKNDSCLGLIDLLHGRKSSLHTLYSLDQYILSCDRKMYYPFEAWNLWK